MPNNNNSSNNNSSRGGAVVPNPSSSPRIIREGVDYAPSPTYRRPDRPGSGGGGNSGK